MGVHMHSCLRLRWPLSPLIYQAVIKHLSISDQQPYCPSAWPCLARFTLFFPLGQVFINFDQLLPNLEFQENYHWIEYINSYILVIIKSGERGNAFNYSGKKTYVRPICFALPRQIYIAFPIGTSFY